jgi:flagellar biosynthesis component FlhA
LLEDCYAQFKRNEIKNILNKIIKKTGTLLNIDEILELLLLYSKDTKDCDKIVELVLNDSRMKNGG